MMNGQIGGEVYAEIWIKSIPDWDGFTPVGSRMELVEGSSGTYVQDNVYHEGTHYALDTIALSDDTNVRIPDDWMDFLDESDSTAVSIILTYDYVALVDPVPEVSEDATDPQTVTIDYDFNLVLEFSDSA